MYGKIIDGKFVSAPSPMVADITNKDGETAKYKIYNPRPEHYEAEGYLKVVETRYPADTGKYYEKQYVERDGKIYGEWVEAEAPEVPEPTLTAEERITALEEELKAAKILLGVE